MTFTLLAAVRNAALALAFAVTFVIAGPSTAAAIDADADGVADAFDQCPGTEALELVNSVGCSVCPCNAAWTTHTAYVNCVTNEAARRALSRTLKSAVLQHANASTCGSTNIKCCTWAYKAKYGSMGGCSILAPAQCSSLVLRKFAENRGTGSCYYNPCTW